MHKTDNDIIIIEKPSEVSMYDVVELIKNAYFTWQDEGVVFGALEQSVEDIIQRIGTGTCLIAYYKDHLVGTISYQKYKNGIYFMLLAVSEDMKRRGVATLLVKYVEQIAKSNNCSFVTADTSEKAGWLLEWYCEKLNYRKYTRIHQPGRQYNSVCFRKYMKENLIIRVWCKIHYLLSLICLK